MEVYATADALVAPDFKAVGLLDTVVVVVKFDNGAIATAEANFSAVYGYDVRAEVFGSADMVSAGDSVLTGMTRHTVAGRAQRTVRSDVELFRDAYAAEIASFVEAVRTGQAPEVTGVDARRALAIALACIESYQARGPVPPAEGGPVTALGAGVGWANRDAFPKTPAPIDPHPAQAKPALRD